MLSDEAKPGRQSRRSGRARVPRPIREQQMLDVATRAFGERGYHDVSMDEIAAGVGVTKPMLYSYFDSKDGLYVACLDRAAGELAQVIGSAVGEHADPAERLWAGFSAFFRYTDEHRGAARIAQQELFGSRGPLARVVLERRAMLIRLLADLLAEGVKLAGVEPRFARRETEALAHAIAGAAESLVNWWFETGEGTWETMAARLMNYSWTGLERLLEGEIWIPAERSGIAELGLSPRA